MLGPDHERHGHRHSYFWRVEGLEDKGPYYVGCRRGSLAQYLRRIAGSGVESLGPGCVGGSDDRFEWDWPACAIPDLGQAAGRRSETAQSDQVCAAVIKDDRAAEPI